MTDETVLKLCDQNGLSELEETPVTLVMYRIYSPISRVIFAKYFTEFSEFFSEKGGSAYSREF